MCVWVAGALKLWYHKPRPLNDLLCDRMVRLTYAYAYVCGEMDDLVGRVGWVYILHLLALFLLAPIRGH